MVNQYPQEPVTLFLIEVNKRNVNVSAILGRGLPCYQWCPHISTASPNMSFIDG